jgi:HipA-like protein
LDVFYGETLVGELTRGSEDTLRFHYAPEWLREGFGISASLPLTLAARPGRSPRTVTVLAISEVNS